MSEVSETYCREVAAELLQLERADQRRRVSELRDEALANGQPHLPIIVGIVLRDQDQPGLAKQVFEAAQSVPGALGMALFEQAVSEAWQGRPADAVELMERHEAQVCPLNAYGQRAFALNLARVGRLAEASARLDLSFQLEPGSERECVELQQFFDYNARFPFEQARARAIALRETFVPRSVADVPRDIAAAVREGRPYSMVRLNDGEGSIIHLSIEDEARYWALYARNRRLFHDIWFGHERNMHDPFFMSFVREFNEVIGNADCICADLASHLDVMYPRGTMRHVPALFNIVRRLERVRDADPAGARAKTFADPHVHQLMLFDGGLEWLLNEQSRIGLVSCHPALPAALSARFGYSEVFFHKTPGEASLAEGAEPFAVWHGRLMAELAEARPGVLYLVAAGVQAKVYCDVIKRAGGVAIDIGSVVDIWMQASTFRAMPEVAAEHSLVPA